METVIVSAVAAVVSAVVSAGVSVWGQLQGTRLNAQLERRRKLEDRRAETEGIMSQYREPLGQAAYDLQSRLFNILRKDLIDAYVEHGDERSRSYVITNTVFLIAQNFAWTEIIRRRIQFIDLGESERSDLPRAECVASPM